ncbi:tetratricopeptide repeat protein [Planomonospora sp. ID67723]|uniref:AfsR/SARP family transcriptional regulator n=1 Tax=Planomonospora sp. ID67723 TaxID=2738134 RepID=UPI0018C36215|nr:BTAD domain-containing putative transcriptional regulator [Planomonospora sp. ID67723]MBG0829605.1 tetratricopeptide repeat protein [Planomonospora sp. ID67723]
MDFRMLGPLEIHENGRQIRITAPKQRTLLALLLLDADQAIAEDRLIDELWNGRPPSAARSSLQAYVYRLRKELAGGEGADLQRDADGYRLTVAAGSRDVERFERAISAADGVRDPCQAVPRLRAALREWRGELLAGIDTRRILDERARYDSMRLAALERCARGELALGRDGELVPELESLVRLYPLSESLWGSLVMALRRAGRRGDAAAAYARARRCLVEELGMEPGAELQRLHQEILEGTVARSPGTSPADRAEERQVPAQLPVGVADFTGRAGEIAELVGAVDAGRSPVVLITGPAGVGKTTLAVHVSHRLRDRYPDGQLYVDLGGIQRTPERPADVLAGFLRALGSTQPPPSEAERVALYRSVLAHRRVLVVLDNAVDVPQVRPLLAAGPACATVITSRDSLATLPVDRRIRLGVFTEDEAVAFLGRVVNGRNEQSGRETAAAVSRLCGHLPLALRIAGARAESLMGSSLTTLAEHLMDHRRRLAELELDDLSVNSSFELSYELLGSRPEAARAFRLLGLIDGPDITVESAAALLGATPAAAGTALFDLVRTQLLEPYQPGRYRMHDLVRLYAAQQAEREPPDEITAAVNRLLGEYRLLAGHAVRVLTEGTPAARPPSAGPFTGAGKALEWFDDERANLLAAVRTGLRLAGCEEPAVATARALTWLFRFRGSTGEWARVNEAILPVARRLGNPVSVADTLDELCKLRREHGDLPSALAYARECLKVRQEIGDGGRESRSHINLGATCHLMGLMDEAARHHETALAVAGRAGDALARGYALANLAAVHRDAGRYDKAIACNVASVGICREVGDNPGQIDALDDLATTHRAARRFGESLTALADALEIAERIGYTTRTAVLLRETGETQLAAGDVPGALASATRALDMFDATSDRYGGGRTLSLLGRVYRAAGDAGSASRCWAEALAVLTELGVSEADEVREFLGAL